MKEVDPFTFYNKARLAYGAAAAVGAKIATHYGYKGEGSSTKTTTKKKKKRMSEEEKSSIQQGYVNIAIGHKVPKSVNRTCSFKFLEGRTKTFGAASGKQAAETLFCYGTSLQWRTTTAAPTNPGVTEAAQPYFTLNPNENTSGSATYAALTGAGLAQDQMFFKNLVLEMDFMNMQNVPAYLDLYFLLPKKDLDSYETPEQGWADAANGAGLGTTAEAIANPGLKTATAGYLVNTHVGNKPNHFPEFKAKWKVLKVKKVMLPSAGQERLIVNIKVNQLVKEGNITDNAIYLKGKTIVVMGVLRGGLVLDATADGANVPTYSYAQIGIMTNARMHFKPVNGSAARINSARGQQLYATNVTAANQKIINAEDVVQALVTAS